MSRIRMEWEWVKQYPVFIYTEFLQPKKFRVKVVIGEKGNQNALGYGPNAKGFIETVINGYASKDEVVDIALKLTKHKLRCTK